MIKTPKLRFKEFSGDWEEKKLGTMGEFFKGSTLSKAHLSEEGSPCVLYGELYTKYGEVIKSVISKTDLEDSKLVMSQKNDVLIPSSGETAIDIATASCLQQENVILGGDLNVFRSDKLNGVFTSYQLNNSKRHEIAKLAQGASVVHVYNNQLSKLKLNVPSKEEQEKIASFFSLIDDKISLQCEKVEALKDYKKGMMQKIFSRELRFKDDDGRDYPEWEEKKLDKLIKVKSNRNKNNEVNLVLSVSNTKGFITQSEQFEDRVVASSDVSNYKIVQKNDFAFNPARINVGSIARLKLYDKGIISPMYICFKCLDILESDYLEYFLMTHSFNVQMKKKLEGSVRQTLSAEALCEIVIELPYIEEQKKIGEFLNTINAKLEKEQEKLGYLNEYKKGLLQQMFV